MGLYSEVIREREENNSFLERYADDALLEDKTMVSMENMVDDAQSCVIFLLAKFGNSVSRVYGKKDISSMLETLVDPLGIMYDRVPSVKEIRPEGTEYVLAFRQDGKSVALYPSLKGYRYYCPFDGDSGFATRAYCRGLQEEGYIFHRPIEEKKHLLGTFIVNVLKFLTLSDIIRFVGAAAGASLLGLVMPLVSRWIYKEFLGGDGGSMAGFGLAILVFAVTALIRAVLTGLKSITLGGISVRVSTKMQSAVMSKILDMPQSFFTENSSGRLSSRMMNCGRLSETILSCITGGLVDLVFSVVYLFQLKSFVPELFLPALLFMVLTLLISVVGAAFNASNEKRNLGADMESRNLLYTSVRGIQRVKSMGAEQAVYAKWAEIYRKILATAYSQPFFLKYNKELLSLVNLMLTFVLLAISLKLGIGSQDYMSFTASCALVATAVSSFADMIRDAFLMRTLCDNVRPLFERKEKSEDSLEYVQSLGGNITLENIWFTYKGDTWGCLRGVSLDIKRGEKLAIVGESGCGKTTLLKIMLGMEKPDKGIVAYDKRPINGMNLKSLRRKIGSVFQFSKVFPGTIASNVAFGAGDQVTEKELWEAVDQAAIGDYIRTLPLMLDTEISESNSSGFSGGQRQRILLARALLRKPKILILDEATSALDNLTQEKVLNNIRKRNCTVVMVAHRLSTVAGFDRIVMLKDGEIVEEGSYEELMEKNGSFAELVRKQLVEKP